MEAIPFQSKLAVITAPPRIVIPLVTGTLTLIGFLLALYAAVTEPTAQFPSQAKVFMVLWLALSVVITFGITPRNFTLGYLTGFATMLIGWRIAGLDGIAIVAWPLLAAFVAFVLQFVECVLGDRRSPSPVLTESGWLLTFLRIYVGFDLIPHFTEKLFAGPSPFDADLKDFASMGLTHPDFLVVLGGLCEFGIMVGIGLGVLTRLAAPCAALYYFIATVDGGHFGNGFIWASPGGGWEYPVLMMVLFLTYLYPGAGQFSVDRVLIVSGLMPRRLIPLSVRRNKPGFD